MNNGRNNQVRARVIASNIRYEHEMLANAQTAEDADRISRNIEHLHAANTETAEKDRILAEYFRERARKAGLAGGRSKSEAKQQAARKNLEKARAAKQKKQ